MLLLPSLFPPSILSPSSSPTAHTLSGPNPAGGGVEWGQQYRALLLDTA